MFVVVFISSTDFQRLLHDVSSLVGRKDNSVFDIPMFTFVCIISI